MDNKNISATSNTENEMISISRAEYNALQKEVARLNKVQDYLMEQLRLHKKKMFGKSSEQTDQELMEQLDLFFDEAEAIAAEEALANSDEAEMEEISYTRKKRSRLVEGKLPDNIPVEVVEHGLSEEERVCPECGTTMEVIGRKVTRTLVLIPAQAKIREDVYLTYGCPQCKVEGDCTPVMNTPKIPCVIPGSYASPEAVAHIMTQKFVMASPLYRMEQEFKRIGIELSRQTMSNWILRATDDWLMPIYDRLHRLLLQERVLHADETTLQVLRDPDKTSQSKSYMWLYRTGIHAKCSIVLYDYRPDRKASNAVAFLDGFSGYLHADGYAGYHKLPESIQVVGCWAHLRRKFDEAVNALPKDQQSDCAALHGLAYCNKLFAIERELAGLSAEERYNKRLERSKPVMDALLAWADACKSAPKSALGRAIYYLKTQWVYLARFLEDGELVCTNNIAERSIKPFVISRKNFLFANTPHGAQGSATMFSLIETARANGLDPYRYLYWIFSNAPVLSQSDANWPDKFLPTAAPDECYSA